MRNSRNGFSLTLSLMRTGAVALAAAFGFGLPAHAGDGSRAILGNVKLEGFFHHDSNKARDLDIADARRPFVYAQFNPSGDYLNFYVRPDREGTDPEAIFSIGVDIDELKKPQSFPVHSSGGRGKLKATYRDSKLSCFATGGKITVTTAGPVDSPFSATLSGMKWEGDGCAARFGTTGSLQGKRALDQ